MRLETAPFELTIEDFNPRTPCGVRRIVYLSDEKNSYISIHAPLAGCDPESGESYNVGWEFQSTHPLRGATRHARYCAASNAISIHAPLAGCDFDAEGDDPFVSEISIHAPLAGCDLCVIIFIIKIRISIHAPLAGCDQDAALDAKITQDFNPRTPCGVRQFHHGSKSFSLEFQSTHPLRGATKQDRVCPYFSRISIHAPLAGCDSATPTTPPRTRHFNPRTPCGVRRGRDPVHDLFAVISIHAPLAGCDSIVSAQATSCAYFNPRTPCGVRPARDHAQFGVIKFQSTHPLRGATDKVYYQDNEVGISIHAPLAGCDGRLFRSNISWRHFNPRTPCGVRRARRKGRQPRRRFQSTHPLRGATSNILQALDAEMISIHAPLAGCDDGRVRPGGRRGISIHAPLAGCDCARYCSRA